MSLTREQALTILHALIVKPETKSEDVARIWDEVISVYNKHFDSEDKDA